VQIALIDLLCDHGADPDRAMLAALGHGEFEAAYALICRGAKVDLPVTAAIGRADDARFLLPDADGDDRHRAVALSALHGHVEVVGMLLDAGEDPNRYNPIGLHGHSTPLHQAIYHGHMEVVQLLIERGARLDIRDTVSDGTPVEWAEHAGHVDIAEYVLARDGST
jgi:ankyrin repeat protein